MKQEFGWAAVAAVTLAGVVGLSTQRGGERPGSEARPLVKTPVQSLRRVRKAPNLQVAVPCVELEERLQTFLLKAEEESIAAPSFCLDSPPTAMDLDAGNEMRAKAANLRFVIATLPDPLHTHFSLSFDRLAEAVQQGATDENYIYDSSWMPWDTEEDKFALIGDQDKSDDRKKDREEQPGIILFRKNPDPRLTNASIPAIAQPYIQGLVVFVVGEEPTQGIHARQFANAAAWIAALHHGYPAPAYKLPDGILGPTFSGSIPSLANLLKEIEEKPGVGAPNPSIPVYSGYLTSKSAVEWLTGPPNGKLNLHFASFQQNDDTLLDRYCNYLVQSHFDLSHLAIVSEDETAYGSDFGPENGTQSGGLGPCESAQITGGRPAHLYYPRDISALRDAYQKESIFAAQDNKSAPEAARRTLSTDIADPEGEQHDTIRNYSQNQTALSEEAVLQQVVSQLRVHQSQYIVLRSSNALDQLFLSHYLHTAYPLGRIVILGSDLLLRREGGSARLNGIMTLTTYPLLPWEAHWTKSLSDPTYPSDPASHSHRVFPSDGAEGTYVAIRFLLHSSKIRVGQSLREVVDKLLAAGYSPDNPPASPSTRSYSLIAGDLTVYPDGPGDPAQSNVAKRKEASIKVEQGEVALIEDEKRNILPDYDLPLQSYDSFLPINLDFKIPDYRRPFWDVDSIIGSLDSNFPPAWLSVLGRNDFWPVAAIGESCPPGADSVETRKTLCKSNPDVSAGFHKIDQDASASLWRSFTLWTRKTQFGKNQAKLWPPMPLSSKIAVLVLFIWAIFHLACCACPSIMDKPSLRAYFVCHGKYRLQYTSLLVVGSLALSSAATIMACGFGSMSPVDLQYGLPLANPGDWLVTLPILWLISAASLVINLARNTCPSQAASQQVPTASGTASAAAETAPAVATAPAASTIPPAPPTGATVAPGALAGSARAATYTTSTAIPAAVQTTNPQDRSMRDDPGPDIDEPVTKADLGLHSTQLHPVDSKAKKSRLSAAGSRCGASVTLIWRKGRFNSFLVPLLFYVIGTLCFYLLLYTCAEWSLSPANRIPAYWRSMNLTSGVSPVIPLLALAGGLYLWFWNSLQGLALFGPDRPILPYREDLRLGFEKYQDREWMRMFSREDAGEPVEKMVVPFAWETFGIAVGLSLILGFLAYKFVGDVPLRSLGAQPYAILVCLLLDVAVSLMLANAWRLVRAWLKLHRLLSFLNLVRLRRSMSAFPDVSWSSVWNIGGSVLELRYKLLSGQIVCATSLKNSIDSFKEKSLRTQDTIKFEPTLKALNDFKDARTAFANWYSQVWNSTDTRDDGHFAAFQECLAKTAGILIVSLLRPAWEKEEGNQLEPKVQIEEAGGVEKKKEKRSSATDGLEPHIRHAEHLVCYVYLGVIQNLLGRMRSVVMTILWLFIAATVAMASYPFDPRPAVSAVMVLLFVSLGSVIVFVYAQMHRDPILSLVTNTTPGELGGDFWIKLAGFGAGPVLGLIATLFPQVTDFIFSWVQPGIDSIK